MVSSSSAHGEAPLRPDLASMLEASSVAVVGASARRGSVGHQVIRQLAGGGFGGTIHPVNPRYDEIEGLRCVPAISDVGVAVDLAVLAVPNDQLEEQLWAAVDAGARSAVIFASCHGAARDGRPLAFVLGEIAARAGLPVCGGNGMGFVNVERGLRVCGFHQPWELRPGGVTFLSHSGSLFSAMLHNHRDLRFNLVVSTGNELATTMDEYLEYALGLDSTRAVGLFLETVRNPTAMAAALRRAAGARVPVVALKVGRNARSQAAVTTHTAALAGDYGAFEAFAAAYGVHLADSLDELADTLQLFAASRSAAPGGLGAVHDSGGERSLLIDIADRVGLPLAVVSDDTRAKLGAVLDAGLRPENPVDAWGTGRGASDVFAACIRALAQDDGVAAVAVSVDLTTEEDPAESYGPTVAAAAHATVKPVAVIGNVAASIDRGEAAYLAEAGIPVLRGTETALRAMRHLLDHRDHPGPPPVRPRAVSEVARRWRLRIADGPPVGEVAALELLADFGIPVATGTVATSLAEAAAAAERHGYPVALKTGAPGVVHKTDVAGVILDIGGPAELAAAHAALAQIDATVVVQPMAPPGVELALGFVTDPQFGPIVVVGAGGTLTELIADRTTVLPPIDELRARRLLDGLRIRPLLAGWRGAPPSDVDALVAAIVRLSDLAIELGDVVASLDVNPLIAHPTGCLAVDAVVIAPGQTD